MASNTYEAVGNKQDISDVITNIAPYDTPLYTRIGRTKAISTCHEWLEDTLDEATENKQLEGFTFATRNMLPRTRLYNYTQIMTDGPQVTGTQRLYRNTEYTLKWRMKCAR